jgi:hypothetical protein
MPIKDYYSGRNISSATWYDLGADLKNGSIVGSPIVANGYVAFAGSHRVEFSSAIGSYKADQSFTFSILMRSGKSDANEHTIFSNRWVGSAYGFWAILIDGDEKVRVRSVSLYGNSVESIGQSNVCDGKWHLIHCRRNGTKQEIWVDSLLEASDSVSSQGSENLFYNPSARFGAESSGGGGAHNKYLTADIALLINRNEAMQDGHIKNEYAYINGFI